VRLPHPPRPTYTSLPPPPPYPCLPTPRTPHPCPVHSILIHTWLLLGRKRSGVRTLFTAYKYYSCKPPVHPLGASACGGAFPSSSRASPPWPQGAACTPLVDAPRTRSFPRTLPASRSAATSRCGPRGPPAPPPRSPLRSYCTMETKEGEGRDKGGGGGGRWRRDGNDET
jgi:hypothetical protein